MKMVYHFTSMVTMMSVSLNSHYIKSKVKSYKKVQAHCNVVWFLYTDISYLYNGIRQGFSITIVDSAFVLRSLMFN